MGEVRPFSQPAAGPATEAPRATRVRALEELAVQAWIYAYPLVLMDVTRAASTSVSDTAALRGPINHFVHAEAFPDPRFKDVVRPNADTLYSSAWLDARAEPLVLSLPELEDRYYVFQMLDAWTNVFAAPGTRTRGNRPGTYVIVGPGYRGSLPEGMERIEAPTSMVWIIGRTQTNGVADYDRVHAFQRGIRLSPLLSWGVASPPAGDLEPHSAEVPDVPPERYVRELDAEAFFSRFVRLLEDNPPSPEDQPFLASLNVLGIERGSPFALAAMDSAVRVALETAPARGLERVRAGAMSLGSRENGWLIARSGMGRYGTDYLRRACVAKVGLGANLPEDAIYPMASLDAQGHRLTGQRRYVIRFEPGQEPPARAFWSISVYDCAGYFVENPIDRYALGDRDELRRGDDGSLELYLGHERPTEGVSNWLPVPEGTFNLVMRIYWPERSVLEGTWTPPPVVAVS